MVLRRFYITENEHGLSRFDANGDSGLIHISAPVPKSKKNRVLKTVITGAQASASANLESTQHS
jgi:hypothetical protein